MMITVEGERYRVVENLGFSHDRNQYVRVIVKDGVERIVVRDPYVGTSWKFSKPKLGVMSRAIGQNEIIQ